MPQAIRSPTASPASGVVLRPGYAADLLIFATDEVRDTAHLRRVQPATRGHRPRAGQRGGGGAGRHLERLDRGADAAPGRAAIALIPTPVTSPTGCSS